MKPEHHQDAAVPVPPGLLRQLSASRQEVYKTSDRGLQRSRAYCCPLRRMAHRLTPYSTLMTLTGRRCRTTPSTLKYVTGLKMRKGKNGPTDRDEEARTSALEAEGQDHHSRV